MIKALPLVSLSIYCLLSLHYPVAAVTLGQLDDFEDGFRSGWNGDLPSISNISTGGPAGVGDNYLQVSSNGQNGPGSRLVTFNTNQWTGDYVGSQMTAISMDAKNLGANPIHLRIAIGDGSVIPTWFVSTTPVILPVASSWQRAVFSLDAMTRTLGSASLSSVLADVCALRILSSVDLPSTGGGGSRGDAILAALGLDNITALQVPEPGGRLSACYLATFLLATRVPACRFQ